MSHFPTADSIAKAGTSLIALGAFWLSFTALRDLAERSGVPTGQAWVWPLIVDGVVLVATVAVVALDRHRWYAWSLLAIGASMSLAGNSLHATYTGELPVAVRILVAAVPPLSLLAATHLTYLLAQPALVADVEHDQCKPVPLWPAEVKAQPSTVPDLAESWRTSREQESIAA